MVDGGPGVDPKDLAEVEELGLMGFRHRMIPGEGGVSLAVFDHIPESWDPVRGPALFLANGLGGNLVTWKHLVAAFRGTHRIATWDYRGLYASRFSAEHRRAARTGGIPLDVPAHVRDARRVLEALGIERAVFFGWSMGVQVNFELARTERARMLGLIQICGASGRTMATTFLGQFGLKLIPPAMDVLRIAAERHAPWLARIAGSPTAMQLVKGIGVVAPSLDAELAQEIVRDYVRQDFDIYNKILMSLADHDATDLLADLDVPTLVVAGTKDVMTPHALSEEMVAKMPQAELVTFEGGSHYLPVEFPDRLNEVVRSYLERRVLNHG